MSEQNKLASNIVSEMSKTHDTITLIVREGQAPPVLLPKALALSGTLSSLKEWAENEHKKQAINPLTAVLLVDRELMSATLMLDPTNERAGFITGKAEFSQDYNDLKMNKGTDGGRFSRTALESLLKRKRAIFPDKGQHAQLLGAVKNFEATTSGQIAQSFDGRGNKNSMHNVQVKNESVPLNATLHFPIFKGEAAVTVFIDIMFDVAQGEPIFWFESMQVEELRRVEIDGKMNEVADVYGKLEVAVINQ